MDAPTLLSNSQLPEQSRPPIFTGPRQALFDALHESDPKSADFYWGALLALVDRQNPERLFQAAHSIRELLEKAPVLAGGLVAPSQRLNDKLTPLRAKFQKLAPHLQEDGTWAENSEKKVAAGPARTPERRSLDGCEFQTTPRRSAYSASSINRNSGIFLPSDVEDAEIEEFMELKHYFTELAHHRFSPTEEDFNQKLTKAETILLRKLRPEPSADFAAIDALLKGAGR